MDSSYSIGGNYGIVFCRNVLIYFDRLTQEKVIREIASHLKMGGHFFLGTSEVILDESIPLKMVKPCIY